LYCGSAYHFLEKFLLKNKNKPTTSSHLSNPKPNTSPRARISDQPDVKLPIFEFNHNVSNISTKTKILLDSSSQLSLMDIEFVKENNIPYTTDTIYTPHILTLESEVINLFLVKPTQSQSHTKIITAKQNLIYSIFHPTVLYWAQTGYPFIIKSLIILLKKSSFSEINANELPPYRPYDCNINLLPDTQLFYGSIYPLTEKESIALKEFINDIVIFSSSAYTAKSFMNTIFRLHDLPNEILSDRGTQSTSKFWTGLCKILNISMKLSSPFHYQTNGLTERVNSVIEQFLRCYSNFKGSNWNDHLFLAEFCYNSIAQESLRNSSFYANYGHNSRFSPLIPNISDAHLVEEFEKKNFIRTFQTILRKSRFS